jgi:hypothetical protein
MFNLFMNGGVYIMNKYRIVMDFDVMANSAKDVRKKIRTMNLNENNDWLKDYSIIQIQVRATQHGFYEDVKESANSK